MPRPPLCTVSVDRSTVVPGMVTVHDKALSAASSVIMSAAPCMKVALEDG